MSSVSLYLPISIFVPVPDFQKTINMGVMPAGQRGSNRSCANICITIRS